MMIEKKTYRSGPYQDFFTKEPRLEMFYTYRVKLVSIVMGTLQLVSLTKRRLHTRTCRMFYRILEQR